MSALEDTTKSLLRVQDLNPAAMVRREELGAELNFEAAEPSARKTLGLFNQLSVEHLENLPDTQLQIIKNNCDAFFNLATQILQFKASMDNATGQRRAYLDELTSSYTNVFNQLYPLISYVASRQRDYAALEREARSKIQQANDRATELSQALEAHEVEAKRVLEEIKKVAAEQGVSQQAAYFKAESKLHTDLAKSWEKRIIGLAIVAIFYLSVALFIHKWPWLSPTNNYEAIQLSISKTLIFAVIAYLLFLSARNFLSHHHNAVVNRHRQNALLTFKSLADAAGSQENRDIVLVHAAACIFSPQETGYTKGAQQTNISGVVESVPRLLQASTQGP